MILIQLIQTTKQGANQECFFPIILSQYNIYYNMQKCKHLQNCFSLKQSDIHLHFLCSISTYMLFLLNNPLWQLIRVQFHYLCDLKRRSWFQDTSEQSPLLESLSHSLWISICLQGPIFTENLQFGHGQDMQFYILGLELFSHTPVQGSLLFHFEGKVKIKEDMCVIIG